MHPPSRVASPKAPLIRARDGRLTGGGSPTSPSPTRTHEDAAHVRLAPLAGGAPLRLGDLPGPITQLDVVSGFEAARCRVQGRGSRPGQAQRDRAQRRGGVTRGLAARLDGVGWRDGRAQLFLVDVGDGSSTQLTRGDYDHSDPAFSPDGSQLAFVSDRHRRRDDRQFRSDLWIVSTDGGRPRRLTGGRGRAGSPMFSPDGTLLCFAGTLTDAWDADPHAFVVATDGSGPPEQVAPDTDRPVFMYTAGLTPLRSPGPDRGRSRC